MEGVAAQGGPGWSASCADPVLGHASKPHAIKYLKGRGRQFEELIG
jgi:hypothetical protein